MRSISAPAISDDAGPFREPRQALRAAGRHLPQRPGVYIMEDESGDVIYVGKAVNLSRRVTGYAALSALKDRKTSGLVSRFRSLRYVETTSELEALLMESRLIKANLPIFNRRLVEPESCCFLRLDLGEEIPRIEVVPRNYDGGMHLGPFWSTTLVREAAQAAADVFRLRRCPGPVRPGSRNWACILHEMGKCSGPCSGSISVEGYRLSALNAWECLAGKSDEAVGLLTLRRNRLSEDLRFEEACSVHRQIRALEQVAEYAGSSILPEDDYAVVVPSCLRRRPVALMFAGGRLADRLLAGPRSYPDSDMLADRFRRLKSSRSDLLPGKPSSDDFLIVHSYLLRHGLSRSLVPLRPGTPSADAAEALHSSIEALRRA